MKHFSLFLLYFYDAIRQSYLCIRDANDACETRPEITFFSRLFLPLTLNIESHLSSRSLISSASYVGNGNRPGGGRRSFSATYRSVYLAVFLRGETRSYRDLIEHVEGDRRIDQARIVDKASFYLDDFSPSCILRPRMSAGFTSARAFSVLLLHLVLLLAAVCGFRKCRSSLPILSSWQSTFHVRRVRNRSSTAVAISRGSPRDPEPSSPSNRTSMS